MYAPTCPYLHCAAVLFAAAAAAAHSFWNENELCRNLNTEREADRTLVGNANVSISCDKLKNEQSKRGNIGILNGVRLLCREFDSLTYVWNSIKNATDDIVIIVEIMSYNTSEFHSILKTNSSCIQIDNLKPNTKYVARFHVSINGALNHYIAADTPIATTLTNNTKPEAVNALKISDFHLTGPLLKTLLTWKPSKSMNCRYKILYYPNRVEMPQEYNVIVNESFSSVLTGLTTDSSYTVKVQSYYNKISPPFKSEKAELKFTTPSCWKIDGYDLNSCPPGQPDNVTVTETETSTKSRYNVTISWTNPNPGGRGVDYFLVKLGEEKKNVTGTDNDAHFYNVLLKHHYFASVQAFSRAGRSTENILWLMPRVKYVQGAVADTDYNNNYYAWTTVLAALAFCGTLAVGKYVHQRMAADHGNGTIMVDTAAYDMDPIKGLDNVEIMLNYKDVIVSDVFLGHGYFGVVKKGMVKTDGNAQYPVAVKSLRDNPSSREREEFLSEILLMQKVGKHPNIVSMIGCCLDANKRCMLIVEYCPLGDLQTYLRKVSIKSWYANDFYVDQANPIELIAAANSYQVESMEPGNPLPMVFNNCYLYHGEENVFLTVNDLMRFASQTANGMVFLEKNRIVHRDLAARNVLLSDHHTIKICDFGLSRDIYEQNLYQKSKRGGPLPVKWMAMESLRHWVYTTQSDVWSFGVLLWEIMTLGGCPYPTISSSRIYEMLCRGYRMPRPTLCCYSLYEVMLECWHSNPANRPKFSTIKDTIDRIMENEYS